MKIVRRNTIRKNKANALRLTSSAASRKAGVSREVKALKVPGGRLDERYAIKRLKGKAVNLADGDGIQGVQFRFIKLQRESKTGTMKNYSD